MNHKRMARSTDACVRSRNLRPPYEDPSMLEILPALILTRWRVSPTRVGPSSKPCCRTWALRSRSCKERLLHLWRSNEGQLNDQVQAACSAKVSIPPDASLPAYSSLPFETTRIQVTNETTLGASKRLIANGSRPLALNFANGIHPGGGFLHGARAQEETICRSSALYSTLDGDRMYSAHRQRPRSDSSDWAIYSPDVPVFRSDDGTELEVPWLLSVVTCAALTLRTSVN